jgi:hypothetical protein
MDRALQERKKDTAGAGKRPGEPDLEFVWRQYSLWIDLYKFHTELLLKANAFFYLITGGILTFYFAHPGPPMLKLSLVLPIIIALTFGATAIYGAQLAGIKRREVLRLGRSMHFDTPPDVNGLRVLLWISAGIWLVVALSLTLLMTLF